MPEQTEIMPPQIEQLDTERTILMGNAGVTAGMPRMDNTGAIKMQIRIWMNNDGRVCQAST